MNKPNISLQYMFGTGARVRTNAQSLHCSDAGHAFVADLLAERLRGMLPAQ